MIKREYFTTSFRPQRPLTKKPRVYFYRTETDDKGWWVCRNIDHYHKARSPQAAWNGWVRKAKWVEAGCPISNKHEPTPRQLRCKGLKYGPQERKAKTVIGVAPSFRGLYTRKRSKTLAPS